MLRGLLLTQTKTDVIGLLAALYFLLLSLNVFKLQLTFDTFLFYGSKQKNIENSAAEWSLHCHLVFGGLWCNTNTTGQEDTPAVTYLLCRTMNTLIYWINIRGIFLMFLTMMNCQGWRIPHLFAKRIISHNFIWYNLVFSYCVVHKTICLFVFCFLLCETCLTESCNLQVNYYSNTIWLQEDICVIHLILKISWSSGY